MGWLSSNELGLVCGGDVKRVMSVVKYLDYLMFFVFPMDKFGYTIGRSIREPPARVSFWATYNRTPTDKTRIDRKVPEMANASRVELIPESLCHENPEFSPKKNGITTTFMVTLCNVDLL